jgi:hypothetical protein
METMTTATIPAMNSATMNQSSELNTGPAAAAAAVIPLLM